MNVTERRKILATIDMTPLMDLTFMLLIIFVITVPSMYYKSDVDITPPDSNTNDKVEVDERAVFVELDKDGGIWMGTANDRHHQSVPSPADLTTMLKAQQEQMREMTVYLVGDRTRKYEEVIDIANAVRQAGLNNLSLVFNPEEKR
ncbi:MAG: biopolymer transporter ExbD [Victivallales bacterium]|nr:biopolymer transporter ExbD [Victivallales bacterium]